MTDPTNTVLLIAMAVPLSLSLASVVLLIRAQIDRRRGVVRSELRRALDAAKAELQRRYEIEARRHRPTLHLTLAIEALTNDELRGTR